MPLTTYTKGKYQHPTREEQIQIIKCTIANMKEEKFSESIIKKYQEELDKLENED